MGLLLFDADSDGDRDLLAVSGGVEATGADLQDRLYLNDGKGNFSPAPAGALPPTEESGGPVAAADFDRDGDLDLFVGGRVVPGQYPIAPASRLLVNQGGTFTDATRELAPELERLGLVTGAVFADMDD
nr:VCBS repeat-containing protein [Akkermansiaceae bacterium]